LQSEVKSSAEADALLVAANIGAARTAHPTILQHYVTRHFPDQENGRVIVINPDGVLIADSTGSQNLGQTYATPGRPELVRVLQTPEPTSEIRHSDTLGQDVLVAAAPIIDEATSYGAVRVSKYMGEVQDRARRVIAGLAVIGIGALVAGLIVAFVLAGSFSRPLTKLAAVAKRLGGGDLSARAETSEGASEIVQLARSFDDMADRLEATVKAQREFVANASHQLRTPLTGMKLRIEAAMVGAPKDVGRQLQAADTEVDRLSEIVNRLLVMARRIEEGGPSEIDLDEAVQRALERWGERASRQGATLTARGEGGRALGEPADLDQILDNLIDNAVAYAPGPVVIETGRADGRAFLAVEDVGPGIAADERPRVTDRFFRGRTAPKGGGTGLGLAIVRELAEKWGGTVVVEQANGGGTRIEVRLTAAN
jgi:signal transduction histidine kinase